ncbi:MAG: helix-turn-helix transcriptional regulator [Arachnia sp.]
MRSSTQLKRLITLVPYLQQHPGISVDEVARHFSVLPRQVIADLEVLQFCGLPDGLYDDLFDVDLEGARDDGCIFLRNADVLSRPMRLKPDEAASLLVALQAIVDISGGSTAARSAVNKLAELLGTPSPVNVEVLGGRDEDRQTLQRAIDRHECVRLDYAGTVHPSLPIVEPARLRVVDGFAYLDAWSRERGDWRSYRLDRIRAVEILAETYQPRPGLATMPQNWFADAPRSVTLSLAPRAAWVAEYVPVLDQHRDGDATVITLPVGSIQWVAGLVVRLGADVLAISDPEVADEAARIAGAALAQYGQ